MTTNGARTYELSVSGMHCASCVQAVERSLVGVGGVETAAVNLLTERALVTASADVSTERLIDAIRAAGFDAELLTPRTARARTLRISGMTCTSCAQAVERALLGVEGVDSAGVNPATDSARVELSADVSDKVLLEAVRRAGYDVESVEDVSQDAPTEPTDRDDEKLKTARRRALVAWGLAVPIVGWMIPEMLFGLQWPTPLLFHLGMVVLALPVVFVAGGATLRSGLRAAWHFSPTMDTLIALGTLASLATGLVAIASEIGWAPRILDYAGVAAMIMALHLTGRLIETAAKGRASQAIRRLLSLGAKSARVLRDGEEIELPADQISVGDVMVVRPGTKIPTDGVVERGESHVDESIATGESMPIFRKSGDRVIGATLNREGLLYVRASAVGRDTFLAQIVRLVQQAQGSKVPIQALADRVTRYFVPAVLLISLATLGMWLVAPASLNGVTESLGRLLPWVHGDLSPLSRALFAAIAVLVIACPCALGLATPTALMVGSGVGAENGILIRHGEAIQTLRSVDTIVFDKTGTLTEGRPGVTSVVPFGVSENEVLRLAGSLEGGSLHPLAQAVVAFCRERGIAMEDVVGFAETPGQGVRGLVDGRNVVAGSFSWVSGLLASSAANTEQARRLEDAGTSLVAVGDEERGMLGLIAIADRIKGEARQAVRDLNALGLEVILVTGDNEATGRAVGGAVGIARVVAKVLPEGKVSVIKRLQDEGRLVAMVGDGINDAPALKAANVGIAIGTGTDVAIETGDITLVSGELAAVVRAVRLSRATFRKIRQNLFWAFFYNVIAIPLAILGLLHPLIAEAAMALSSINVVTNANRLRRVRLQGDAQKMSG